MSLTMALLRNNTLVSAYVWWANSQTLGTQWEAQSEYQFLQLGDQVKKKKRQEWLKLETCIVFKNYVLCSPV